MKNIILFTFLVFISVHAQAQLIAKVQMKENVEGICDNNNVYSLYHGWTGQVEPACFLTKAEMQALLNEVPFLKNNPKFKGNGMVGVYINCEGITINWEISVKSDVILDQELLAVFKSLVEWTAGTLNGKPVDCRELISYKIKKGVLTIN